MTTFILELSNTQVELIAQLLHIHLNDDLEHPIGEALLQELVDQTNVVKPDRRAHMVGLNLASKSNNLVMSHSCWHVPYDPSPSSRVSIPTDYVAYGYVPAGEH